MDGVVTNLPEPYYTKTLKIWKELEESCGIGQVFITPVPHFSWQVAAEYDIERLKAALTPLCQATKPFTVHTSGIGIFTQPNPTVYIALVKDKRLMEFHARVYAYMRNTGRGDSPFYHPDYWMPHITLVFQDLKPENTRCVFEWLAFEPFHWQFTVDHLSVLRTLEGQPVVELLNLPFEGNL